MAKFKIGDVVKIPEDAQGAREWWKGKEATVRAVLDGEMYEVLFNDAQDFAFIEEHMLVPGTPSTSR